MAMDNLRPWRSGEPLIHRAAFIGLDMAESNPTQSLNRHDRGKRR
jgi:hypothetical protein